MLNFRVVCFTTILTLSFLGLSESSSRSAAPGRRMMTPSAQGFESTKFHLQIPANALNGNPLANRLGDKLAKDIMDKLSVNNIALNIVPFPAMHDWQKYSAMAFKSYLKSRDNDEDYKRDCLWELQDMMGEFYEELLEMSVLKNSENGKLNPRQEKFIDLVRDYFKASFEKFIGLPLIIKSSENPNKIAKKKLLESFEADKMYNRKKKMTVGNIVKEDIPMEEPIEIDCDPIDEDVIEDGKLWKPEGQLKSFIKEHKIPIFSQPPKAGVKDVKNYVYFCSSPEDETSADFYVYITHVQFVKIASTTATKSRRSKTAEEESNEYPDFVYFQTYLGDDRIHIADLQRLTFDFKGAEEEGKSEEAAASDED